MPVPQRDIEKAKEIARAYGATRMILFGSAQRDFGSAQRDPKAARDLDLAIGGVPGWTIWKLAGEVERAISVPLDVVPLEPASDFTRLVEERGEVLFER